MVNELKRISGRNSTRDWAKHSRFFSVQFRVVTSTFQVHTRGVEWKVYHWSGVKVLYNTTHPCRSMIIRRNWVVLMDWLFLIYHNSFPLHTDGTRRHMTFSSVSWHICDLQIVLDRNLQSLGIQLESEEPETTRTWGRRRRRRTIQKTRSNNSLWTAEFNVSINLIHKLQANVDIFVSLVTYFQRCLLSY